MFIATCILNISCVAPIVLSTIDFSSDSMSSDILLDFGSFDLDDDEDALQTRIDRMRAAFLHSRKTYGTSERIYTEPGVC